MKNSIRLTILCILALAGCKKPVTISSDPFMIEVDIVRPGEIYLDVIPETNDFYYFFGSVSKADFESFANDADFIDSIDRYLRETYDRYFKSEGGDFSEKMLYKGAYKVPSMTIIAGSEYYAYAFPYDESLKPIPQLSKKYFKTPESKYSDITFNAVLNGSKLTVEPSNDDTYFFDYDLKSEVDEFYGEYTSKYYELLVSLYNEYGFFPAFLQKGIAESDMTEYFNLKVGDEFYLFASGYDGGINSPISTFLVTYKGEDQPGIVSPLLQPQQKSPMLKPEIEKLKAKKIQR